MQNLTAHQKGLLAVLAAAVLWSTGGMFIKLISLNAYALSFFRSLFAAAVFYILFRRALIRINGLTIFNSMMYAAILILFVIATKMTTAANAIFLQYTAPIYVLVLEPIVNKTPFKKINIITVMVCFGGMLLFFMGEISPGHMEGNIIALLSGAAFAAFLIGMRKNRPEYQFPSIFYGNIIISAVCAFSVFSVPVLTAEDLGMVAFLGVFQIGIAYAIFSYGLKRVYAVEASLISMIEPVLNPVWVYFGYGEAPSIMAVAGGIIIISAISVRSFILESGVMKGRLNL